MKLSLVSLLLAVGLSTAAPQAGSVEERFNALPKSSCRGDMRCDQPGFCSRLVCPPSGSAECRILPTQIYCNPRA